MNLKNFPKRLDSKTSSLRIAVPENLDLALEGLIRKVLREQPKTDDIYTFAADYFETLLKIRDKTGAKFTAAQLCPFHNDEDAHEMIKLAGTFPKPASAKLTRKESPGKPKKPVKKTEADVKNNKKTKPKEKVKEKKPVKQVTPDLIKKLPTDTKPEQEVETKTQTKEAQGQENQGETKPEIDENEEEFLASDPIKELVEKELLLEASSAKKKTDGNEKTEGGAENAQEEDKQQENVTADTAEKGETRKEEGSKETNEEAERQDKSEETENEKPAAEVTNIKDEGTKDADTIDEVKTENENSPREKAEETEKDTLKSNEETREETEKDKEGVHKNREDVMEAEKQSEAVAELPKAAEVQQDDKKEGSKGATHKEKIETFPVTESGRKVTDSLPTEKLPEISEDAGEKNQETPETESGEQQGEARNTQSPDATKPQETEIKDTKDGQQATEEKSKAKNTELPTETIPEETEIEVEQQDKTQPNEEAVTGPVEETSAESVEVPPADVAPVKNDDTSKEAAEKEDTKTEEEKPVSDTHQVTDNEKEEVTISKKEEEEEMKEHNKSSANASQDEQPKSITVHEPKPEESTTEDESKPKESITANEPKIEEIITADEPKPKESTAADEPTTKENITVDEPTTKESITADEPKPKDSITLDEDKTFGEIIKNSDEETAPEEIKPNEANKVEETTGEEEKLIPVEVIKTEENISENKAQTESIKPTEESKEKLPAEPSESNQLEEDKKPEISNSGQDVAESKPEGKKQAEDKEEITKVEAEKESENQEIQSPKTEMLEEVADDMLVTPQAQPEVQTAPEEDNKTVSIDKEEPKPISEETATKAEQNINQEEPGDELCSVVDNKPKEETVAVEKPEGELEEPDKPTAENIQTVEAKTEEQELTETKEVETEPEELCTVVDVQQTPKEEETEIAKATEDGAENIQTDDPKSEAEELCMVVDNPKPPKDDATNELKTQPEIIEVKQELKEEPNDAKQLPAEDNADNEKPNETKPDSAQNEGNKTPPATEIPDTQHIIRVEEVENPTKPDEIQIKTIQTHYYDTLQVPETVTREYRVHNVALPAAAGLVGAATFLPIPTSGLILDENMNSEILETLDISPPAEETKEDVPQADTTTGTAQPEQVQHKETEPSTPLLPLTQQDVEAETQRTDSDELLDLMTPTSGYSMNLSEISLLTASELFLDSEKRYSSLEKEETRYVTPKTDDTTDNRQEVEEVIEKTVLPSGTQAVPVPPREDINEEANVQLAENVKEKKEKEEEDAEKPEKEKTEERPEDSVDGSSNGRSVDSDTPFISVEVKTVIETQVLDDEEEEQNGERPEVEVQVRATIDIQDDVEVSQPKQASVEGEKEMSEGRSPGKTEEVAPSLESQSKDQDEERKESSSTGMEGSSSLESDLTASSAATEIKRTNSGKRNSSSVRSLVSTQSLDYGKRNPLLKTRSLSTFRHGVTDFEVWNKIEKELEDAAIKIQSKFRGYKTRKKLQRENAVQITTEESSVSTTPVEADAEGKDEGQQSTGEFHDSIILSEHPR